MHVQETAPVKYWRKETSEKIVNIFGYHTNAQSTICAGLLPSIISFVDAHWEDKSLDNMTSILSEHGGYCCQLWGRQTLVPEDLLKFSPDAWQHDLASRYYVSFNMWVGRSVLISMPLKLTKANTNYCQSAWWLQLPQRHCNRRVVALFMC